MTKSRSLATYVLASSVHFQGDPLAPLGQEVVSFPFATKVLLSCVLLTLRPDEKALAAAETSRGEK